MKTVFLFYLCRRRRKESLTDCRFNFEPRHPGSYWVLSLLFALISTGNLFAADAATDFSTANKLYAEGKFADAANTYEKILQTGAQSPALLFNDANAEFKAGNLGRAITAYRRAALLAPRDTEIRANLQFVRNQVQGPAVRKGLWFRIAGWLEQLTLNEWTLLVAGAFWLAFLLLAARQLRPALGAKLKTATSVFIVLTVLSGAALGVQAAEHFSKQTAVVVLAETTARSGPFDEAQSAFTAHDGAELAVLDHRGGWIQVADGSGQIGWLPVKHVEILPGA
jgi:tetratricopeptide (TPR) repeat protein